MDHSLQENASMMRQPVVAGQFYPGQAPTLRRQVATLLAQAGPREARHTVLAMVPHAGYVYSGPVVAKTLGQARLADRILLLGPNHTGRGRRLAVWPTGEWRIPGGSVPVDQALADALLTAAPRLTPDVEAHFGEHSLEVELPFLVATNPGCRIVPICVAESDPGVLRDVAAAISGALTGLAEQVSIVVSSDMSHYLPQETAKQQDSLALDRILALDPEGLFRVVRQAGITMCGVLPMVLGMFVAKALGATKAVLAAYGTSGEASGDFRQVVGYAGVIVRADA